MVAETEVMHQGIAAVLEHVQYTCVADVAAEAVVTVDLASAELELRSTDAAEPDSSTDEREYLPTIRSGSFANIGRRRYMEDEHIRIDDLSSHLGSILNCPSPSAFYGVFDGHGGADAAVYMKRNAIRFFFEDSEFPQSSDAEDSYLQSVESSVRQSFLHADLALSDDSSISRSSGTTALTALVLGRLLLVANAGDCRAVLCRKGVAMEMSEDHRPAHPSELRRVTDSGGFIEDGYLNGVLSVTRALGDWDMKSPDHPSPLIAEPEFRQLALTEDEEFLIIGCDGIWDVMTSQQAVSLVRKGLRRHDDPERCARELVMEALRLNTFDNLTAIVICFNSPESDDLAVPARMRCCKSLSVEALCKLRSWLESDDPTDN